MAIISSIGTGAGRDYSTIAAWLGAFAPGGWVGQCYNDSTFDLTATLDFSGISTSSADFITLECAAGQSINDVVSQAGSNALAFNPALGVAIVQSAYSTAAFYIEVPYVTLVDLQTQVTGGAAPDILNIDTGATAGLVVDSCILDVPNANGGTPIYYAGGAGALVKNCLITSASTEGDAGLLVNAFNNIELDNCTLAQYSGVEGADAFYAHGGATITINNSAIFGCPAISGGGAGTITGQYNCSDLALSSDFTNSQSSQTYADQFVAIGASAASSDFRLKSGSACIDNGYTDPNVSPAVDIVGTTRPQGSAWCIGCWEYVGGGSGGITVTATVRLAAELDAALARAAPLLGESAGTLRRAGSLAAEASATPAPGAPLAGETLAAVMRAAPLADEALRRALAPSAGLLGEVLAALRTAGAMPDEFSGAVLLVAAADALLPLEWLADAPATIVSLWRLLHSPGRVRILTSPGWRRLLTSPGRLRILDSTDE